MLLQPPGLFLPQHIRLNASGTLELNWTRFIVSLASVDHELSGHGFLMISEKGLKPDLGCRPMRLFPLNGMNCCHLLLYDNQLELKGCDLHLGTLHHSTLSPDLLTKS